MSVIKDKKEWCGYTTGFKCGWQCNKHLPERPKPRTVNDLIYECHDPEIKEVMQAFVMLKQFDAGYRFAQKRAAALSQEAIDKCHAFMLAKLEEDERRES